jgi:hypothetical protein
MVTLILLIVAIVCFTLAALGVDGRLTPVGLALFAAAHLPL